MKEIEKMVTGKLYNASLDSSLVDKLKSAKKLCLEYNALDPDEVSKKQDIIIKLFAKIGKKLSH